jgi:hypothetical protein
MSKTNHQRGFKAEKFPAPGADFCCGKKGERRNTAGLKKFVHSRHRAGLAEDLVALEKLGDPEADITEVRSKNRFPNDYMKRYN